jgi:CHAD domain-containing protein
MTLSEAPVETSGPRPRVGIEGRHGEVDPAEALQKLARAWSKERRRVLRDPLDPEATHRLRTATRRLVGAVEIAQSHLGLSDEISFATWDKLRRRLGRLRNWDVVIGELESARTRPAGKGRFPTALRGPLERKRDRARVRAIESVELHRVREVPAAVARVARRWLPPTKAERQVAASRWLEVMNSRLAEDPAWNIKAANAASPKRDRQAIHQLRRVARDARYGLEWWEKIGVPAPTGAIAFTQEIQGVLGRIRDLWLVCKVIDHRFPAEAKQLRRALGGAGTGWTRLRANRRCLDASRGSSSEPRATR